MPADIGIVINCMDGKTVPLCVSAQESAIMEIPKPHRAADTESYTCRLTTLHACVREPIPAACARSLGAHLSAGPETETAELDSDKLAFMREAWADDGSEFRGGLLRQVRQGTARPWVSLRAFAEALRDGAAPADAYIFHNVSGCAGLARALRPLRRLWRETALTMLPGPEREGYRWAHGRLKGAPQLPADTGLLVPLVRLGLGGDGLWRPVSRQRPSLQLRLRRAQALDRVDAAAHAAGGAGAVAPSHMLDNVLPMPEFQFQNVIRSLGRGARWQDVAVHVHATGGGGGVRAGQVPAHDYEPGRGAGRRRRGPPRPRTKTRDPRGGFAALAAGLGGEGGVDLGALCIAGRCTGRGARSIREPRLEERYLPQ
jgi:hypothetical protein